MPVGSWLAENFGWRSTFVAVGAFTALALITTTATLPALEQAGRVASVRERLRLLHSPAVLTSVLGTVIGACAAMMTYTYIAPITRAVAGDSDHLVLCIALVGISGAIGTVLGGRVSDLWGADKTMLASFVLVVIAILSMTAASKLSPPWPFAALPLTLYGLGAWGNSPPMNSRILTLAGQAGTEAVALNTSGLYLGIALAAEIGGLALDRSGGEGVLVAAATIGMIAVVLMALAVRHWPSPSSTTEARGDTAKRPLTAKADAGLLSVAAHAPSLMSPQRWGVSRACASKWVNRWRRHGDAGRVNRSQLRTEVHTQHLPG